MRKWLVALVSQWIVIALIVVIGASVTTFVHTVNLAETKWQKSLTDKDRTHIATILSNLQSLAERSLLEFKDGRLGLVVLTTRNTVIASYFVINPNDFHDLSVNDHLAMNVVRIISPQDADYPAMAAKFLQQEQK